MLRNHRKSARFCNYGQQCKFPGVRARKVTVKMIFVRAIIILALGLSLSACASARKNSADADAISQAANSDIVITNPDADLSISNVTIRVPDTLVVSEENRYYPSGDIVWREDPPGDRRAQVKAIFEDGIGRGVATLDGPSTYDLDIEVLRFHALTQKKPSKRSARTTSRAWIFLKWIEMRDP